MSPRNAGVFCLCRSVIHLDLKKTETDQPVRLGPDRRFPTIKTGGFPLSRQRDIPSSGDISPRPNRLTETKTSHSRTVDGWIRSEPSHFPYWRQSWFPCRIVGRSNPPDSGYLPRPGCRCSIPVDSRIYGCVRQANQHRLKTLESEGLNVGFRHL